MHSRRSRFRICGSLGLVWIGLVDRDLQSAFVTNKTGEVRGQVRIKRQMETAIQVHILDSWQCLTGRARNLD
jgi:hypothetical protein